ncbi:hypothetical protein PR048_024592 [Dryococelus australis]|uniref:Uncharacterized protein n=1 Tax=Dryococelus australis TaxID=614101 RepID=A0ABQ9GP35_9NEOP|nr:hypothetical protein PR048_024592 [Dryococelus australis]
MRVKRDEYGAAPECKGEVKREIPEKTRRRAVSPLGTIPKCENPGATPSVIEPDSPRCEASSLTSTPPRPRFISPLGHASYLHNSGGIRLHFACHPEQGRRTGGRTEAERRCFPAGDRGGVVVRLLTSHHGEPVLVPCMITPDFRKWRSGPSQCNSTVDRASWDGRKFARSSAFFLEKLDKKLRQVSADVAALMQFVKHISLLDENPRGLFAVRVRNADSSTSRSAAVVDGNVDRGRDPGAAGRNDSMYRTRVRA